ncbi:hypothetical protein EGW08_019961, partial [Elysia chlorotica]
MLSLKCAERVFVAVADYGNSEFISDKRKFLDKIMTVLSNKDAYVKANAVIKSMGNFHSQSSHFCQKSQSLSTSLTKAVDDKIIFEEPEDKRIRLEVHQERQEGSEKDASGKSIKESFERIFTFRMSIKCSGKLRKKLDLKRLSRDIGWRVEQASGWAVQLRQPDLEVCVHISDDHVTVGVPLTRHPLSRRNYIQESGLRAPIAWIMCTLAEIKFGDVILDPMCGKATILLEGASSWQDAFYIGNDNATDQINVAAENASSNSEKINVALADGLNMPYRDCCVDVIVCDAPFNQKYLTSLTPYVFFGKFLQEIHRVLRSDGCCVMLVSQQLVSVILTLVQDSESEFAETKDMSSKDTHPQEKLNQDNMVSPEQKRLNVPVAQRHSSSQERKSSEDVCETCTKDLKSQSELNVSDKVLEHTFTTQSVYPQRNKLFALSSQHDVK